MACGVFVLAKRVPDTDLLFRDGIHLRYFDTVEEFFDLANWYLAHEEERIRIANAGMEHVHAQFNCVRIAKYMLDLIETGTYDAPWGKSGGHE
jgi:spore maturation protein CgeB